MPKPVHRGLGPGHLAGFFSLTTIIGSGIGCGLFVTALILLAGDQAENRLDGRMVSGLRIFCGYLALQTFAALFLGVFYHAIRENRRRRQMFHAAWVFSGAVLHLLIAPAVYWAAAASLRPLLPDPSAAVMLAVFAAFACLEISFAASARGPGRTAIRISKRIGRKSQRPAST